MKWIYKMCLHHHVILDDAAIIFLLQISKQKKLARIIASIMDCQLQFSKKHSYHDAGLL